MQIFSFKTRTNLRRNSPNRRRFGVLVGIILCGVLALSFFGRGMGGMAAIVFSPIASTRLWLWESSGSIPSFFRSHHSLAKEVAALEAQVREQADDAFHLTQLRAENAALAGALALKRDDRHMASVIVSPPHAPYDTFVIDKGAQEGIVDGAMVYVAEDVAIGVIAKTYTHSALVRLVSTPGTHVTAYVFGPNIFTEAEGMGGGVLRVSVPQGVPLAVDDVVVLPAAGAGAYGRVVSVDSMASNPEQYGYVMGPTPLQSVRFVAVAVEPAPTLSYEAALAVIHAASSTLFHIAAPEETVVGTSTEPEISP